MNQTEKLARHLADAARESIKTPASRRGHDDPLQLLIPDSPQHGGQTACPTSTLDAAAQVIGAPLAPPLIVAKARASLRRWARRTTAQHPAEPPAREQQPAPMAYTVTVAVTRDELENLRDRVDRAVEDLDHEQSGETRPSPCTALEWAEILRANKATARLIQRLDAALEQTERRLEAPKTDLQTT